MNLRVIVIDDNRNDFDIISRLLRRSPDVKEIVYAECGKDALKKIEGEGHDIAFLDLKLPDINGIELLETAVKSGSRTAFIMITGQGDENMAVSAMKSGAYDYIVKDELDAELLAKTISHTLERKRLKEEKEFLESEIRRYTDNLEEKVRERTAEVEYLNNYKELILSTLNNYIRVVDPKEKVIQYESHKIKVAFGDGVGKPCYMFWKRNTECDNCISIKAIEGGIVVEKEEESGDRIYHVTAIPINNRDGSISAIEVITDVTEKRNLEEVVERSKRLAAMGEISAHVAHEIRNPLNIIKMGIGLISEQCSLDCKGDDYLKVMKRAVASLEELVNDVLELSRPYKPNWTKADINGVIEESVDEMASTLNISEIELRKELPKEEISCMVDVMRLKSLLKNLISNSIQAIKTKGKIIISVKTKNGGDIIQIKVSDNGRGISDNDLKRVFDPFFTTNTKGTGLGMCIVKKIIDMQGGNIDIQSEVGRGTEVTVNLPVHRECLQS